MTIGFRPCSIVRALLGSANRAQPKTSLKSDDRALRRVASQPSASHFRERLSRVAHTWTAFVRSAAARAVAMPRQIALLAAQSCTSLTEPGEHAIRARFESRQ